MPRAKKAGGAVPVEATVHREASRTNIPTSELEGFLQPEDRAAKKVLYPRDPTLDPQLVWKGKDEQDAELLEVPAVPIYIQEKIAPKALIEDLRTHTAGAGVSQPSLFADFNGIEFDELVDFYQHQQNWSNRVILGDSLLVMTSLAEKEALKGQVQCIYVDPPYGIKFGSNWQVSTRKRDVKDGRVTDATRQPEQVKAFRDTWEMGIHSYLTYLRDRLVVARELLAESGSVFVQIGDTNTHLVRALLDEVFGSENFAAQIPFAKTGGFAEAEIGAVVDYLIWYAKSKPTMKVRQLFVNKERGGTGSGDYSWVELPTGERRRLTKAESDDPELLPAGSRYFIPGDLTSADVTESGTFSYDYQGVAYFPKGGHWKTTRAGLDRLATANRMIVQGVTLRYVRYFDDFPVTPLNNLWADTAARGWFEDRVYVVQTAQRVVQRCILMTTDPGDLVLDPTCGSGTTAFVAEQFGRRWITIDTSRVALAIARTRLMAAKYPFYVLADSGAEPRDIRRGFIYKKVPHVTLKSIANNPDVKAGLSPAQVGEAISKHSDTEVLYDQPDVDRRTVRVAGPFTIESLSPHLMSPPAGEDSPDGGPTGDDGDTSRFQGVVLSHLRKAGVQNTFKNERLVFETLEPWAGTYIHAVGEYQERGKAKRAAICIGPEYGTVNSDLVREAAKEAVKYFDLLVVCGFAFDGYVAEETRQLGGLTILRTTMNPDLALGEDLLKKTGAGNLFMVFGEPDITIHRGDQWEVEIRGLDVYDPTTGEVRSQTTDDIACWFIDTDYNGESFFVRHAYFLGRDDPYEDLKRALRADVDEEAWKSLNSSRSRSFPAPATGKIAVKVINHYGDEVLKVYEAAATH